VEGLFSNRGAGRRSLTIELAFGYRLTISKLHIGAVKLEVTDLMLE
jgi:hypothetical protein